MPVTCAWLRSRVSSSLAFQAVENVKNNHHHYADWIVPFMYFQVQIDAASRRGKKMLKYFRDENENENENEVTVPCVVGRGEEGPLCDLRHVQRERWHVSSELFFF